MPGYYELLIDKITAVQRDPAVMRQVVYEAARVALRKHISSGGFHHSWFLIRKLEEDIAALEANADSNPFDPIVRKPENRPRTAEALSESEWRDQPHQHRQGEPPPAPLPPSTPLPQEPFATREGSRELVSLADADHGLTPRLRYVAPPPVPALLINDAQPVFTTAHQQMAASWRRNQYLLVIQELWELGRAVASGIHALFRLAIVVLTGFVLYAAWSRHEMSAPQLRGSVVASSPSVLEQAQARPVQPQRDEVAATVSAASAATFVLPTAPGRPFPLPTTYGIYAISAAGLSELEPVATAPVDPRTRTLQQISKPSRTVLGAGSLAFIAFRRDYVSSAPEKVPLRIAAHIARTMIFDTTTGQPVVTKPPSETWLIRDRGYDLRVSPVHESPEMILIQPEEPSTDLPAGRYELMLGGQPYDFSIEGLVDDPAHCVESSATTRGPVFYECKVP